MTGPQLLSWISTINTAHKKRFPQIKKRDRIKAQLHNEMVEGRIQSINNNGLTLHNEGNAAGGHSESTELYWIEIINLEKIE